MKQGVKNFRLSNEHRRTFQDKQREYFRITMTYITHKGLKNVEGVN